MCTVCIIQHELEWGGVGPGAAFVGTGQSLAAVCLTVFSMRASKRLSRRSLLRHTSRECDKASKDNLYLSGVVTEVISKTSRRLFFNTLLLVWQQPLLCPSPVHHEAEPTALNVNMQNDLAPPLSHSLLPQIPLLMRLS